MLKVTDISRLKEFGFKEFKDRVYNGYLERGTENGYEFDNGRFTFLVATEKKNWKWINRHEVFILELCANDYDISIDDEEIDLIYDLITAGIVVKE